MNRIIINSIVVIAVLFGCTSAAQAQQYILSNTTLNGAITSTGANSLVLTSASAFSASNVGAPAVGQCLYVERELMQITAISSTRATVIRGTGGTGAALHPTAAVVFTGPCNAFKAADPVSTAGVSGSLPSLKACTLASMGSRPFINVLNGNVWLCISSVWTATNAMVITYNSVNVF